MAKDSKKVNVKPKYKAANPKKFASNYTDIAPYYEALCKGEAVDVNLKDEQVKMWLANKIIVKE